MKTEDLIPSDGEQPLPWEMASFSKGIDFLGTAVKNSDLQTTWQTLVYLHPEGRYRSSAPLLQGLSCGMPYKHELSITEAPPPPPAKSSGPWMATLEQLGWQFLPLSEVLWLVYLFVICLSLQHCEFPEGRLLVHLIHYGISAWDWPGV